MIKSKSEKGITLTTLVVTIVVLLILAGVATSTGIEAIENTKFTKFKAELKIMQSHVNQWYEDCKPSVNAQKYDETFTTNIQNKLTASGAINATSEEEGNSEKVQKAQDTLNKANVPSANYGNYYLLEENTKNSLGVEGVSQDVLVSVKDRKVISYLGLKYKNKMYYTIDDQSGEGIGDVYNVEYDSSKSFGTATFDVSQEYIGNGKAKISISNIQFGGYNNKWQVKYKVGDGNWNTSNDLNFLVTDSGHYTVTLYNEGISGTNEIDVLTAPECWRATTASDPQWYSYGGAKVNSPKLIGKMTPIKYTGDLTGETNLWANAETADQSMWVWIPRYAYKITSGYHTNAENGGTIEIAFLKGTSNTEFWDTSHNGEAITANPSEVTYTEKVINGVTEQVQDQWLVHPAFTSKPENGGWDEELTGIWFAKFETTGTITNPSVKPGLKSIRGFIANDKFKASKQATFSENVQINSHMIKNSEWGAAVYLTQSIYGVNKNKIEQNLSSPYSVGVGGSNNILDIYTTNKKQSTTANATGIYDMNGGSIESVASYVNYESSYLATNGGTEVGDLYGADSTEQNTSTKYKTVYTGLTNISDSYPLTSNYKGDAIWETSNASTSDTASWYKTAIYFPGINNPFFRRSHRFDNQTSYIFSVMRFTGGNPVDDSFRIALAF